MWFLFVFLFFTKTISNTHSASYRGTMQLDAKIDAIQKDIHDLALRLDSLKSDEILQLAQHTDATLKDFHKRFEELQKQSQVWSTYEHFITSWLEQINAVDRKLDIIIKGQERLNKVETQLNLLHEQINKIDIDKFEHLVSATETSQKNKGTQETTKIPAKRDMFSFIDEYTTRGVLSTLNRIEKQLAAGVSQESATNCSEMSGTFEMLEDIASKIDIVVDKMSIPEPAMEPPIVKDQCETDILSADHTNCLRKLFNSDQIIVLNRGLNNSFTGEDFLNKSWTEYENGFSTDTAYWWGLTNLEQATLNCSLKLRIELWDFEGHFAWAEYERFNVADDGNYTLTIGGYSGNATDSFSSHNGIPFSTYDRNNDQAPECCPCAKSFGSGWWFNKCFEVNLNGKYNTDPYDLSYYEGIIWDGWLGNYSLQRAKMIITSR